MMSDASEMLAAALEQMDGIIAGTRCCANPLSMLTPLTLTVPNTGGASVTLHVGLRATVVQGVAIRFLQTAANPIHAGPQRARLEWSHPLRGATVVLFMSFA